MAFHEQSGHPSEGCREAYLCCRQRGRQGLWYRGGVTAWAVLGESPQVIWPSRVV